MASYRRYPRETTAPRSERRELEALLMLGMNYSSGRGVPIDLVAAHKWFNIAAASGSRDAVRLRREVAVEMSDAEIAAAQREARAWMTRH